MLGCLYGGAAGDAVGAPAEGCDPEEIRDRYGWITDLVEPDGGLLVDPDDVDALARAYDAIQRHDRGESLVARLRPRLASLSIDEMLRRHEELYDALTQ